MSDLDNIAQERQRLADRLAKIDADRAKLADQLAEMEAAERVLSRFSQTRPVGRRGRRAGATATAPASAEPPRGRRATVKGTAANAAPRQARGRAAAKTAAVPSAPRRAHGRPGAPKAGTLSLRDATLRAVEARGGGVSAEEVRNYLANEFGMQVRPNHLGMALQRHLRAGRLEQRDSQWFLRQSGGEEAVA